VREPRPRCSVCPQAGRHDTRVRIAPPGVKLRAQATCWARSRGW
jgi:hypothetical protein